MRCVQCQHENAPQSKFCSECGARLSLACRACGAVLAPQAKFCAECGAATGAARGDARFESPKRFIPKHLAERILTSKASLEGERKQVTVLFADMKGSMELLAARDPEDARKLLDPVLERMIEAVHRYEGTVNQVMGDGVMALFGAPVAHEDHAVRACYAALRMQQVVKALAAEVQRSEGVPIQIRVGLNSGEVVVRSIGSDLHMDYTAVGQTTHLAARLEQAAMPGSILVGAETLKLCEDFVEAKPLGPMKFKGLTDAVEVFELLGASTVHQRLGAGGRRSLTAFVGRTNELEQLQRALELGAQGRGQVLSVVGEPGVGKSRLFFEFTRSQRTRGWLVLESCSVSYGKATAHLPIIELLKRYFRIEPREDARGIREKVTGKLLALDRALEKLLPAILALLDVPVEDQRWRELDPPERRRRTVEAVKHLLLRESQEQPICLVLEDLHWIDGETQMLLDSLIESIPTARVLLLANYRPEYRHGWNAKSYYTQLRIDALPKESADELLKVLLGSDPGLARLKQLLVERTQGNPFFLEESVRTLVETAVLEGERGARRLIKPVEPIQVPATVQTVLAARIDRLSPEDKHVLQVASVIGETVPLVLLESVIDASEDDLQRRLSRLQTVEFLYQTGLFPEVEYTFKHGLTYQVAYESLLQEHRRALHARIVEALETQYPGRQAEQVERLAHHAVRGALWDKALHYLQQAGGKAAARSATREALALLDQALEVAEKLPDSPATQSEVLDLLLKRGTSLIMMKGGHHPEVERCYAAAQQLCERLQDHSRLFPAVWGRWAAAFFSGRCRAAKELAERLHALGEAGEETIWRLEGHHCVWSTCLLSGELKEGQRHTERGIELYDPRLHHSTGLLYGGHDPGTCARFVSSWMLWDLGYPEQALKRAKDAERLARELAHVNTVAAAGSFGAFLHYFRQEFDIVLEQAQSIETLVREHGLMQWFGVLSVLAGSIQVLRGRQDEGFEKAASGLRDLKGWRYTVAACALGDAFAHAGLHAKGIELTTEAIAASERDGLGFHLAELYRLRGEMLAQTSTPDGIKDTRRAIEIAHARRSRMLELRATISHARMLRSREQREEARGAIEALYRGFDEGMDTSDLRDARTALDELA